MKLVLRNKLPDYNWAIEKAKGDKRGIIYRQSKKKVDEAICWEAQRQLRGLTVSGNCAFVFKWYCKNRMKDPDNISSAVKYIFDGLQLSGILPGDGFKNTSGGTLHLYYVDKQDPRVEITILEGEVFDY